MKIGAHISALQAARKAPYETGIENAAALGFDAVELIAMDRAELDDYYTPDRISSLRRSAEKAGMDISQFAVYSTACEGMASLDAREREEGVAIFKQGIDVCAGLGAPIVNLVTHWPIGLTCPHPYPPSYIHPLGRGMPSNPTSKVIMDIPRPFDFDAIWENYVGSLSEVTAYAGERGVKFAIEGHAHVIVSGTDAMLRLFERITDPNLVVNFDTAWHFIQREYLPMSILKLGKRIEHVHLRDSDGLLYYNAPVGQGVIDMRGVVSTLKEIGYDGVLSFEYSGFANFLDVAKESQAYMRAILRDLD
jgi:sugar phosphate isomerase/epimerase